MYLLILSFFCQNGRFFQDGRHIVTLLTISMHMFMHMHTFVILTDLSCTASTKNIFYRKMVLLKLLYSGIVPISYSSSSSVILFNVYIKPGN